MCGPCIDIITSFRVYLIFKTSLPDCFNDFIPVLMIEKMSAFSINNLQVKMQATANKVDIDHVRRISCIPFSARANFELQSSFLLSKKTSELCVYCFINIILFCRGGFIRRYTLYDTCVMLPILSRVGYV